MVKRCVASLTNAQFLQLTEQGSRGLLEQDTQGLDHLVDGRAVLRVGLPAARIKIFKDGISAFNRPLSPARDDVLGKRHGGAVLNSLRSDEIVEGWATTRYLPEHDAQGIDIAFECVTARLGQFFRGEVCHSGCVLS